MNPRVSRSSALASKATGFPIAKVAAKLAVGYTLDEVMNEVTGGATPASFEPTIDYVVTKVPRFAFEKFPQANDRLTTQMKSVGEVMAIGRVQESFRRRCAALEVGVDGLNQRTTDRETSSASSASPAPSGSGTSATRIHARRSEPLTGIDPWFLAQSVVELEMGGRSPARRDRCRSAAGAQAQGILDRRLGYLFNTSEKEVRARHALGIRPVFKRVDTCAAEFSEHRLHVFDLRRGMRGGADGQAQSRARRRAEPDRAGIEFDYCCVRRARAARGQLRDDRSASRGRLVD
jgi:carbamoyl-phosphate synthase large subunit